ncbi:DUF333 domain-containing protein [Sorangium sp. So ce1389]|uniref:DUF333 domain-containing protein n=1 Tax=Sorangium sp. So ce1389 TaxID=3133336 RepID=UPI003F614AEA
MKLSIAPGLGLMVLVASMTGAGPALAIPNPASVFCEEVGGSSIIASEAGGDVGICRLSDGSIVEEWTLFRAVRSREVGKALREFVKSTPAPLPGAHVTWAEQRCAAAGGHTRTWSSVASPGTSVAMCTFDDGTAIGTWTLFGGRGRYPVFAAVLSRGR